MESDHRRRLTLWLGRRWEPAEAFGVGLWLGLVVVAALATLFAMVLRGIDANPAILRLDQDVAAAVAARRSGWLTAVMRVVTVLGSAMVLWPVLAIVGVRLWLDSRRWGPVALLVAATLGGSAIAAVVKVVVGRARPERALGVLVEGGYSFPSGHATAAMVAYVTLAFVLTRPAHLARYRPVAWIAGIGVAVVIAASRVYLGVHWLSDVVGGALLGAAWVAVLVTAYTTAVRLRWVRRRTGEQPFEP